jgi:hypothetical protein
MTLEEIQSAIENLSPAEIESLRRWLAALEAQRIDARLEADAHPRKAGSDPKGTR